MHRNSRKLDNPCRRTGLGGMALAAVLALAAGACDVLDSALDVEAPGLVPAEELENPGSAALLVDGAIADFDCALGSYIVLGGVITDELEDATPTAARWVYDQRDVDPLQDQLYATSGCTGLGVYTPLSTARYSAESILQKLEGWTDEEMAPGVDRTSLIATAAAYSGYSHLLLGEGFCSGVLLDPETLEPGGEVQRDALFQRAEERFTRAIEAAQASGNTDILNMALVGRARARLDLGRPADAAADAALVPEGFEWVATASLASDRRENRVWDESNVSDQSFAVSVDPQYQGLEWEGVADPRVPTLVTDFAAQTGIDPVIVQLKYDAGSDPLPIATWDEAQLIIAEAELEAGNTQGAVDIINMLHDNAGLPEFNSTDPAEVRAHLIQERQRELWLEGHRLFDVVRYGITLEPAAGTQYRNGGVYGSTNCLPLPAIERLNNPNIGG